MTATATDKIIIDVFTDPMMGLSYEQEPVLENLQKQYPHRIEYHYVMSLLVRDISDFMLPDETIAEYNQRLAHIYLNEIHYGGLPMNMKDFHLFDEQHRSSLPLNLAYEAVALIDPNKTEMFLYALRRAIICEGRQMTKMSELLSLIRQMNIDSDAWLTLMKNGQAKSALKNDLELGMHYHIRSLPSYIVHFNHQAYKITGMINNQTIPTLLSGH